MNDFDAPLYVIATWFWLRLAEKSAAASVAEFTITGIVTAVRLPIELSTKNVNLSPAFSTAVPLADDTYRNALQGWPARKMVGLAPNGTPVDDWAGTRGASNVSEARIKVRAMVRVRFSCDIIISF